MMGWKTMAGVALVGATTLCGSALAGWTELIPRTRVAVANSGMTVAPAARWNRTSAKPSKFGETWSFDGPLLNRIDFYGAVPAGQALLKERNKKRDPLPTFAATMQPSDVAEMYERTARIVTGTSDFAVDTVVPVSFAGRKGFRFTFHYTGNDDALEHKGLASGAVVNGKLYLVTYAAPSLYYFDAGLKDAEAIMNSAAIA
jgi:hypothetical protein